ncbi:MAG: CinA family protein [Tumebacillaceae bacterium]
MEAEIGAKMEEKVVVLLKQLGWKVTTMESCTGGAIINRITNVSGSSDVTDGGYVTYSNKQKINVGVPEEIVNRGVYNKPTAVAMAETALRLTGSNVAVGVTGTFSNVDENNPDSEKGVVYFSICDQHTVQREEKLMVPLHVPRDEQKRWLVDEILKTLVEVLSQATTI